MHRKAHVLLVGVFVQMVDPGRVEGGRTTLDPMDLVALGQQQFGQVGAVLPRDTGDQCNGHIGFPVVGDR